MASYDDFRAEKAPLTVVFFGSATCAPCKAMLPLVQRVATASGLPVRYFDIAQERATVQRLRLRSVPTVLIVGREAEVPLFTGMIDEEELRQKLAQGWVI